jgi:membrane fusion protein, copper/silver efflux system
LAVPESVVVHPGERSVLFIENMPRVLGVVEVLLGPRCGEFYPVVEDLEAGQKVAARGAFLFEAESRLNPSLARLTTEPVEDC